MADELVSEERWEAGADYLRSLRRLGLDPEALFWAQVAPRNDMVLVLVSSVVDRVGSTEIYDTLMKAYDHSVTPRSIDPWIVSLFGPQSVLNSEFNAVMRMDVDLLAAQGGHFPPSFPNELFFGIAGGDYNVRKSWVYLARRWKAESKHQIKAWRAFQRNVDKLAA